MSKAKVHPNITLGYRDNVTDLLVANLIWWGQPLPTDFLASIVGADEDTVNEKLDECECTHQTPRGDWAVILDD